MESKLIATLVTSQALDDFSVFIKTIQLWNGDSLPTIYVFGDAQAELAVNFHKYPGQLHFKRCLTPYTNMSRQTMERMPGKHSPTLWMDFQMEKLNLLDWVFKVYEAASKTGVFYFDADICFLAPLPDVPSDIQVALCPHHIRKRDEGRFGRFNAGYVWMRTPDAVTAWRTACAKSRFFEQAALEVFETEEWLPRLYEFPIQHNYGWWRLWQGERPPQEILYDWSITKDHPNTAGITVNRVPLASVHTHWYTDDYATQEFNMIVRNHLNTLEMVNDSARKLLKIINSNQ